MVRWRRWIVGLVIATVVVTLAIPWVASVRPLRNMIVNATLNRPQLLAESNSASFAWFFPQQLFGLSIKDQAQGLDADAEELTFDRSLWQILAGQHDGARLTIHRPRIALATNTFDSRVFHGPRSLGRSPNLMVAIEEAIFTVSDQPNEDPNVFFDRLDLKMNIEDRGGQKVFTAEPSSLLDHEVLTPVMCRRGLHLVNPLLADATEVEGTVSLALDRLLIPLESSTLSQRIELEGHLVLHQVLLSANPLLKDLMGTVTKMLRLPPVERVQITDQSQIRFVVRDGKVFHEGLSFGLPKVSDDSLVRTSGWVGLDRSLDLNVEFPIPLSLLRDGPIMRKLSEQPLLLHVGGTLDHPQIGLPPGRAWHEELASRLLDIDSDPNATALEPIATAVLDTLGELLERRRDRLAARQLDQNLAEEDAPNSADPLRPQKESSESMSERLKASQLLERFRGWRERRRKLTSPPVEPGRGRRDF